MNQSDQIDAILKRKGYRNLNNFRLKPTPDLTYPPALVCQDELDEAKLIFEYEQALQDKKSQRGY